MAKTHTGRCGSYITGSFNTPREKYARGISSRDRALYQIDVCLSEDGEIICAHDSNFTRMTVGNPNCHRIDRGCGAEANYAEACTAWWEENAGR